ncbi:hypothetical protein CHS0354_020067 [Potamilus streckersoni]|uniref:Uncharacterized protein n=1 Tax=Potamilus streckersoni TaxID=2493646 RepID=A0AAE0SCX9_9BIVA|nr:hypothetical protein CHS0354_020067 [Potamilus streckersoni]
MHNVPCAISNTANNIMEEAELNLEIENFVGQVENTKKEKYFSNKFLKKQKLILENDTTEIETVRSETNVTVERSNDLDNGESSTSKNESYGTHSCRHLDEDTVKDLSTPISYVSCRQSTSAQDTIPVDDLYDEYNRQLIAINMD